MKETYTITVTFSPQWLKKWDGQLLCQTTEERLQLWMEIQTAGTDISVESVTKEE